MIAEGPGETRRIGEFRMGFTPYLATADEKGTRVWIRLGDAERGPLAAVVHDPLTPQAAVEVTDAVRRHGREWTADFQLNAISLCRNALRDGGAHTDASSAAGGDHAPA